MKKILALCGVLILGGAIAALMLLRRPEVLGQPFQVAMVTPLATVLANPAAYLAVDLRTEGRIVRQCPSSGCWFFLDDGQGRQMRVELGHLGMKFPQHVGGVAEVEGRLLQHGQELELVGNGVRFK